MKIINWLVFCLLVSVHFSATPSLEKNVTLTCKLTNCAPTLFLFEFDGVAFRKLHKATASEDGSFVFKIPKTAPNFYYVGNNAATGLKPIILGQEEQVVLKGNCTNMRSSKVSNSSFNKTYDELKYKMNNFKAESNKLNQEYVNAGRNTTALEGIKKKMQELDNEKFVLLDSLEKTEPFFAKILALNTYVSFQNNGGAYPNELDYFVNEFFQFADFKDETFNRLPWVFEAFKSYTETLSKIRISAIKHKLYIDNALAKIPTKSRAHQLALGGVVASLKAAKHPNFINYANEFISVFTEEQPEAAADLQREIDKIKNFTVGGMAPDFTQKTPEGEELSLSSLKGKVVLIDFWASWCGPCRRENPNVVRLYNKYKEKGFEVIGVSLDKTKSRWVDAIKKDNLTWQHVSDLKGWQNAVAQEYGVSSIPHTLLLDKEGKIIATKLRAHTLEAKLKEIFGE